MMMQYSSPRVISFSLLKSLVKNQFYQHRCHNQPSLSSLLATKIRICYSIRSSSNASTTSRPIPSHTNTSDHNLNYEKEMTTKTLALARSLTESPNNDIHSSTLNQRRALSKAITLIESRSNAHMYQGDLLLNYLIESNENQNQKQKQNEAQNSKSNSNLAEQQSSSILSKGDKRKKVKTTTTTTTTTTNNDQRKKELKSFRIGIAGAPGSGKSTFIEKFGIYLLDELKNENNNNTSNDNNNNNNTHDGENNPSNDSAAFIPTKLAALCIDPSSTLTGGSILGDKTRMTELSRHPRAFVRPSPSRGDLGGVTTYTNDVITLCQAAEYDLVMVETVGIGQSEVSVSQVVDMLILVVAPGGGDGLQGVKKGIMEVADLLIVNKADGKLLPVATSTAADYKGATCFLRSRIEGWEAPPVLLASAKTNDGFKEVWESICKFRRLMTDNGELDRRKAEQSRYWMWKHIQGLISSRVKSDTQIADMAADVERSLDQGLISPRVAASDILECLHLSFNSKTD